MGGTKTSIQAAPTTPAPNPNETAAAQYQAQLQYNPQLYEQYAKSYAQYLPQLAGTELAVQQQYAPQMQALQQQMYPNQTQLVEAMSQQALQRMNNQFGYSESEQAALDAIRGRQTQALQEQIRTRSNLGGGLYGGRAQAMEQQGVTELQQGFADQDIQRKLMAGQQALQYATPVMQIQYPQVQNPQYPQYWQGAVPSADSLYNAYYQASQPQQFMVPGDQGGLNLGILGRWGGSTR